jgi:hypothetical protein
MLSVGWPNCLIRHLKFALHIDTVEWGTLLYDYCCLCLVYLLDTMGNVTQLKGSKLTAFLGRAEICQLLT